MAINYNIEKLKKSISELCTVTDLSMLILDQKYNILFSYQSKEDIYCRTIQASREGASMCYNCDLKMLSHSALDKKTVSHICHGGLCDSTVPIIKNGIVTGYIIIGRVRLTDEIDERTLEHLCNCGIAKDILIENYKLTTCMTKKQLEALKSLVSRIFVENDIEIEYDDFITRATDYIENNLANNLSVTKLCQDLFVSKNFLYKTFNNYFNKTVNDYITERRINRAIRLLAETESPAYEIAEAVGFMNYAYFSKLFKLRCGVAPQKYRKQHSL